MADNVTLSTVTAGGVSAATDDVGGVHFQRIKLALGADGTTTGDVSSSNPMPVVNSAAVTVTGSVGVSGPVAVHGSVGISGPVTVTGSVTAVHAGPVTVTGTVNAAQSGNWSIMGPVTVTGSVTAVHAGPVTVTGSVGVSGPVTVTGSVGITGPVTVTGAVSVLGSLTAAVTNLLGATVVNASTVTGTVGVAKRVDTQATVNSAVNTATPLHVNEFGSLWVVSEAGDAQTTNGGGTTGIQVFVGSATTVGSMSISGVLPGPVTVTGSVGVSGPVTVTGSVTAVHAGPVTVTGAVSVLGSLSASINNLLGASVNAGTTVTGTVGVAKRVDALSATVGSTVGGAVALQTDAFGALWVNSSTTTVATVSGPMTVLGTASLAGGSTGIAGPVTVTGSVTAVHAGPVTVTGSVGISGPVTVTGSVESVGMTAHGSAAAGNPVLLGIEGRSTDQTAVDSGDVTRVLATLLGKQVVQPYAIPAQHTAYAMNTAGLATTVAVTALASAGAGTRWYITSAQAINQGGAVTRILLQDGAGAVYWNVSAATSGGGVSATFPTPIRIAANQTVEVKLDTTGTTAYVNFQAFKAGE